MTETLIHLICGSTGAGKTTYARRLAEELGAVRFSIDEWMADLFWMDSPQPIDPAWAMARVERCGERIWSTALELAVREVPSVLDLGFTTREQRRRAAERARAAGLAIRLHWLDVSADERWRRVQARDREGGPGRQLGFDITREMFDFVEGLWEPPDTEELRALDAVRADSSAQ